MKFIVSALWLSALFACQSAPLNRPTGKNLDGSWDLKGYACVGSKLTLNGQTINEHLSNGAYHTFTTIEGNSVSHDVVNQLCEYHINETWRIDGKRIVISNTRSTVAFKNYATAKNCPAYQKSETRTRLFHLENDELEIEVDDKPMIAVGGNSGSTETICDSGPVTLLLHRFPAK